MFKKLKALLGGYTHQVRNKKYILISNVGKTIDYNGYLGSSRDAYFFQEFDTKAEAFEHLKNEVSRSEREDWILYVKVERTR